MASSFVKKLFDIVENEDDTIIRWVGRGMAFEVLSPKRLETEILPKLFRHCHFQSFVRQLNFYAFKKVSKERSSWVYSHDCFVAGCPDLLDFLKRKTNSSAMLPSDALEKQRQLQLSSPHSINGSDLKESFCGRKRSLSCASSHDSDEQEWVEADHDRVMDSLKETDSNEANSSAPPPSFSSWEQLLHLKTLPSPPADPEAHRPQGFPRSRSVGCLPPKIFSIRKRMRRSFSLGEVEKISYEDINFEDILSNWENVRKYFTDNYGISEEREESETKMETSRVPSSSSPSIEEDNEVSSITVDGPASSPGESAYVHLERFCLQKSPLQRSGQLSADIHGLLRSYPCLEQEMADYSSALSPGTPSNRKRLVHIEHEPSPMNEEYETDVDSNECEEDPVSPSAYSYTTPSQDFIASPRRQPFNPLRKQLFATEKYCHSATSRVSSALAPQSKRDSSEISTVRTFLAFSLASLHSAAAAEQDSARQSSLLDCADKWGQYAQGCL